MSLGRIDMLENMVLASAVHDIDQAKKITAKLSNYKFTSDARRTIFKTICRLVNEVPEITHPIVSMSINITDTPHKDLLQLKDARVKVMALTGMYSPLSIDKHIQELLDVAVYDRMAREYYEYLENIDQGVPYRDIIAKNDQMIIDIIDEQPNDIDDFVVSQKDIVSSMKNRSVTKESYEKVYYTGDPQIDSLLKISRRNIILIAGKNGSYKTKYMIYILKLLQSNNNNISVLHYLMEDPADKAIRAYIAPELKLSDSQMLEKGYTMTDGQRTKYEKLLDKVSGYDVVYVNKGVRIKEIGLEFKAFRKKRPGRFCILVIDNIMKLLDGNDFKAGDSNALDIFITREIDSWNIKTSTDECCVFLLHHFIDAQLDQSRKQDAYRPLEKDIRGSGRYRDSSTQIMLLNSTGNYPDIKAEYPHLPNIIQRMTIVDLIKNRNDGISTLRYVAFPEYSSFMSLESLIKKQ
jgi:replicative DNA helicase